MVQGNIDAALVYNPHTTAFHDPAMLFGALDEHLTKCSEEGRLDVLARLDEVLYSEYSDLAAISQMLAMVRLHRPRRGNFSFKQS
jgi:hypothetical protein